MLSTDQIRAEVAKVAYKDDWWFQVAMDPFEGQYLFITAIVPNPHGEEPKDIGISTYLPPMPNVPYLHRWIAWRIERIEVALLREFYRVAGVRIFEPCWQPE